MLIHKASKGVIHRIFTGKTIWDPVTEKKIPQEVEATFENVSLDNPQEWVYLSNHSKFAPIILKFYPDIDLFFDEDGRISGIAVSFLPPPDEISAKKKEDAKQRGYTRSYRNLRPTGIFPDHSK